LIEIGSKTAKKNSAQTDRQTCRQTDRHYENNGHLAVNQKTASVNCHTHAQIFRGGAASKKGVARTGVLDKTASNVKQPKSVRFASRRT